MHTKDTDRQRGERASSCIYTCSHTDPYTTGLGNMSYVSTECDKRQREVPGLGVVQKSPEDLEDGVKEPCMQRSCLVASAKQTAVLETA